MNVLFLMFVFPDRNKGFNMYTSLVEEFHTRGHNVIVLAPGGSDKTDIRNEGGINILRVKTLPVKNVNKWIKGISNVLLPYQYDRAFKKFYSKEIIDLIITPTPPITLVGLASKIKRKQKSVFYLILRDIFPQNAVDLGMMNKKSVVYRYFRAKEKKLYKNADYIGCLSEANVRYITDHNKQVDKEKLHILSNFQKLNAGYPVKDVSVREKIGLKDKFIIVFGGNMGKAQQLENVIALAKSCTAYQDVVFLLLGEGVQKEKVRKIIEQDTISNIKIINTIPKDDYQLLLSSCDIGLISLHKDFTIPNIPSKALDYMNLGIPILASIDRATDFDTILDVSGSGLWSYSGDLISFKKNFETLYLNKDLREKMGKNGRKYFEENLTPEKAYNTVISCIKKV